MAQLTSPSTFLFSLQQGAKRAALIAAIGATLTFYHASSSFADSEDLAPIRPGNSLSGNYLAARIAATDRDLESAVSFYRQAMLLDTENVELKRRGFQTFIANGNFDEAVELGKELAKVGQIPEIGKIVLAVNHLRSKGWATAETELTHNWRSAIDRLVAGLMIAWAQVGEGKIEKALQTTDALKGPAWFDLFVQYHSGLIALQGKDSAEGIRRLEQAFNNRAGGQGANHTYMRAVRALAQAQYKAGEKGKAMELVKRAVLMQPQNPIFQSMQANLETDKGLNAPIKSAQRGAAEVFLNLGTALNKDGGEDFARIYMQLANTLVEGDESIVMQLADLYDQLSLPVQANDLFATIEPTSPFYRIARLEIAINLDSSEDLEAARVIFDNLVETGPDDLTTHLSYGAVLSRHEKFDEVIPVLNKLVDRISKPERMHWSLFYRLGIAYERTKQWELAEATFKKALEIYPDQPSVLNYLGYSWIDMNMKLEEGLKLIQKAVEIRPNDGYMVDSLGWAFYKLGRYDEAVEDLERAVALRPADPTINDHLGDAYWRNGRKLEATFQWRHALALDPPEKEDIARIEKKLEFGLEPIDPAELAKPKNEKPDNG